MQLEIHIYYLINWKSHLDIDDRRIPKYPASKSNVESKVLNKRDGINYQRPCQFSGECSYPCHEFVKRSSIFSLLMYKPQINTISPATCLVGIICNQSYQNDKRQQIKKNK